LDGTKRGASRATGRKAGTLAAFSRLIFTFCGKQISKMDQRDKELLDKQLRRLHLSPRSDGVMVFAFLAAFFTGTALGGFLFTYNSEPPMQIASNDVTPQIFPPNGAQTTKPH
jgi:hypothetical protein